MLCYHGHGGEGKSGRVKKEGGGCHLFDIHASGVMILTRSLMHALTPVLTKTTLENQENANTCNTCVDISSIELSCLHLVKTNVTS